MMYYDIPDIPVPADHEKRFHVHVYIASPKNVVLVQRNITITTFPSQDERLAYEAHLTGCHEWCIMNIGSKNDKWHTSQPASLFRFADEMDALAFKLACQL